MHHNNFVNRFRLFRRSEGRRQIRKQIFRTWRRCQFEQLEKRELLFAANWTNILQPLDVTGDVQADVSPLDVLAVVNELNSPVYSLPNSQSLPNDVPDESKRPFLDVNCDSYVSPLDALVIINAINTGNYDPSWSFSAEGGSTGHAGKVVPVACSPKLVEGDSFRTELSAKLVVPNYPAAVKVEFDTPSFDSTSNGFIRDAFEIALLDAKGNAIVSPITTRSTSVYNSTEGVGTQSASGISANPNEVLIGLTGIPVGTSANVVVRLINNDGDETSQVRIKGVHVVASNLKADLILPTSSSDPVSNSPLNLSPSLSSSASPLPSDPPPVPNAPIISIVGLPTVLANGTRLVVSGNASISSSPAGQPGNRIQSILINGRPVEAIDAPGNFFDSSIVQAGQNRFSVTVTDSLGRATTKTVGLMGVDAASLLTDLSRYDDVSASFAGLYGRTQYGDAADLLTVELASKNDGTFSVEAPLLVTVANISDPTVKLRNADGITPQGNTYLNYSSGISGKSLSPSTATGLKRIEFYNPNQVQFKYDLGFFSKINSAPIIATAPVIEAIVDKAYSYSIQATDENGDSVSYRLVESPKSMTIDSNTGKLAWAPKTADIGNHNIVIEAIDGRGGVTAQRFTLAVTTPKPNRPPVFNSTPIVDAFRGEPYVYNALATDSDGDTLSYHLVDGAPGLQVDIATGQLKSTLPGAVIFDAAKDFSTRNNPVGPWSYGWTQDQGSEFHVFPNRFKADNGLDDWNDPSIGSEPILSHNGGATPINIGGVVFQPGQLSMHPGLTNRRSVVRWTAPASGKAEIGANFSGLDNATTDVHVLQNGKSVFDGNVNGRGSFATMDGTMLRVTAGDAIDFVVGFGNGTYNFDSTSLDAVVQMDIGTVDRIPITLNVVDGHGGTAQQSFTIDIHDTPGNHDPKIISTPQTNVSFGETYTDTVVAVDPDADPLTYSLPAGPVGMTIDASTGKLIWQGFEDQNSITGPSPSNGLTLSSDAIAAGYELTEFARNIPGVSGVGPLGFAFPVSGGVLVSDYVGNVRPFPTDVDGQDANKFSPTQNFGYGRAFDMAQLGRKIYMTQRDNGTVVELNDDGTLKQTIVSGLGGPHGIVANPTNSHLLVSSYTTNIVYDIDPIAKTTSVLFNASLDGISISADGSVLYGAAAPSGLDHIYGYSLLPGSIGNVVFDSGVVPGDPDGTALGGGILAGTIFANNVNGSIVAIDLKTKKQTIIASGGTRGDFATIDPNNGTMLLTQSESVVRLRLPLGSSFTATTNGLKLTQDAISAGFELTEFARKIPTATTSVVAGPLGIAFPSSGGVLVSDFGGNVRRLPSHADGQDASLFVPSQNYGLAGANDIAQIGRNIYMTTNTIFGVVQIDEDGNFVQNIVTGLTSALGVVANPKNDHLIVASDRGLIYDVDPIAKTSSILFQASLDGIAISSDGSVLYGASVAAPQGHIVGYSLLDGSIGNVLFDSGLVPGGPDGIAIGGGEFEGQLFVNTNQGSLVAIDLNTKQQTTIATGGTRGDFVKVDPTNGTLLLTQTDTIARLRLPFGSSFVSDFDVKVHVYDGKGGSDEQDFRLHLNSVTRGEIHGQTLRDPPGLSHVSTTLTVDNRFALFHGTADGSSLSFVGQDNDDYGTPGSFSFNTNPDEFVYVVAWDIDGYNMFIGDFLINDFQRVSTNKTDWEYVIGSGVNPRTSFDPPPLSTLQSDIARGGWTAPTTSADQPSSPWGTFVPAISPQAQYIWADSFGSGSTASRNSYVIFRLKTPVPPIGSPGFTVYLDQNQNGRQDPFEKSAKTDLHGNYSFKSLIPATYYVTQVTQAGRKLTTPAEGNYALNLGAGQILSGIDFTNSESTIAEIRGMKFNDLDGDGVRLLDKFAAKATVPGTSNLWLSGMPNGSTAGGGGDSAPNQSPAIVDGLILNAGEALTIEATGSVNFQPGPSNDPPDGNGVYGGGFIGHSGDAENGISGVYAPVNSLVAVFVGSEQPSLSPAPPTLIFQPGGDVQGGIDYLSLAPKLKQVFFVGDGLTQNGKRQQIIVPEGATRLYLGSMDGIGWSNNFGAFSVTVNGQRFEPGLRDWKIYLDLNSDGKRESNEPSTTTDTNGEYAFTNLSPGNYIVAEELAPTYDASRDFSVEFNPNNPWTYGFSQTRGSEFQLSTLSGEIPGINYWTATNRGPYVLHNLTGSVIPGGVTYPANALNLDPSVDGRNAVLRFTAPVTDTYHIQGRFQGIDATRGTTTDVAILQDSQTIFSGNINGFFSDIATTPGAILSFDMQVTVTQGKTLDFSVGQGTGGSLYDGTGFFATIVGSNWRQTAPNTKNYALTLGAGEVRRHIDFGNQNPLAAPLPNQAPKLTSTPTTSIDAGVQYVYQAKATDVNGDKLKFDLPVKPVGMAIDPSSGILVWTPTFDQIGVQNVILRVSDGRGGVDLQSFQINVSEANIGPIITSKPPGPAVANLPYQYRIRAQDANGDPITFALKSGPLGDMAIDSMTGVLTWRPTAADIGTHSIDVTATDPDGDGQGQRFDLTVLASAPNRIPTINSTPRHQARLGSNYLYSLDATDPDGDPLAYQLDVSPTGMAIDPAGLVTWTPLSTQFGDNQVKIRVSDGRGGEQSQSFTITVLTQSENHAPAFTSTAPIAATLGTSYRYAVVAYDADGDTIAYSLTKGPKGMSIDTLTGAIRWTPSEDQIGSQEVIVQAMDTLTASTTQRFTITVRGTNLPPAISSVPITVATVGRVYTYAFRATDPEGGPLIYSLVDWSGDMSIDASGIVRWTPTVGELSMTKVTIRVRDELGATADQSYSIIPSSVGPNLPPIISSQPILAATVGQQYRYQVTATDPEGGAIRFAFLEVPVGMTIDENTGLILWTSSLAGIGRVTVLVGDLDGGETEQSFEVTVRSTNAPPKIDSSPITKVASGVTYHYDVHASDPNLDPLTNTLTSGPNGMAIDDLGRIAWTTKASDVGTQHVKLTVSDDRGASAVQEYDLSVTADTEAPKVRIQVSSNPIALDETLELLITATDNTHVKAIDVTVDGKAIALDSRGRASLLMSKVGSLQIAATATDDSGNIGRQAKDVLVIDTTVTDSPEVDVTVPVENATITAPTDVMGTVKDPNLISWKLEVIASDGTTKQFASGTSQVANAKLGTFDPTLLQNDSYILRLTALNRGGLSSSIDTTVNVAGNLKLGNFTLSFTDLSIPVGGIPITVSRTYDTLTANQNSELGFGWKLAFRDVDLRTSLPKTGDEAGGLYTPFRDGTRVYVTLPGGQREGFTFKPKAVALFDQYQRERDVPPEYQPGNGLNAAYFVPSFVPDKGVTNKLTVRRYQLSKQGHEYFQFGGGLPYNPEDPSFGGRFTLTTKDGITFNIDAADGKLTSAVGISGASLTFSSDSIANSAGGKIAFDRDLMGRIVSITDLNGQKVIYEYNATGDLIAFSDRAAQQTRIEYSSTRPHYLERVIDPLNRTGLRTEFDSNGKLIKVSNGGGTSSTLAYDPAHSSQTVTNGRGFASSFVYDAQGNIISETDPLGNITTRTFNADGNLLTESDPLGHTTKYSYDSSGSLLTQTDALGNVSYLTYVTMDLPGFGNMVLPESETDPMGNTMRYQYDSHSQLISATDGKGQHVFYKYDSNSRLISTDDGNGHAIQQKYDNQGNIIESLDAMRNATKFSYTRNGFASRQSTTRTDASGNVVEVSQTATMNANDKLSGISTSNGKALSLQYDAAGNESQLTNSLGAAIRFNLDQTGHNSGITYPDGTSASSVRDANGNISSYTDRQGRTTLSEYDAADRLIKTTYPDGAVELNEYDAAGNRTARIDANGNRTTFTYDADKNLIVTTDPLGNRVFTAYDANNNVVKNTDANGNTTRFETSLDGTRSRVIYPDGTFVENTIDRATNSSTQTDESGSVTKFNYDAVGAIVSVIDAMGNKTSYTYDELGQLLSQTDANKHVTRWEYNDAGSLSKIILPLGMAETSNYSSDGRLANTVNFDGVSVDYTYDDQNRVSKVSANNVTLYAYTYTTSDQIATVSDTRGITRYTYNAKDQLVNVEQPDGMLIQYEYDTVGNRKSLIPPSGKLTYGYDKSNRLTGVTDPTGAVTSYKYDPVGNLIETAFPNGVSETRTYDVRNHLLTLQQVGPNGLLQRYSYTLDKVGHRTDVVESSGRQTHYTYDPLGRLIKEFIKDPFSNNTTIDYTYDPVGNRLSKNDSVAGLTTYAYDANDRLTTETNGNTVVQYQYDNDGNQTARTKSSADKMTATWNALDEIITADVTDASGNHKLSYVYDQNGIRVSETVDGNETRFLVDEQLANGQVIAEYTSDKSIQSTYYVGLTRIAQDRGSLRRFYLADGLCSVRILTDANGSVTDRYSFDSFGNLVTSSGSSTNRFLFAGEQFDSSLGAYYLRARHYLPSLGRFASQDSAAPHFENSQTLNRYVYALNDPATRVDPSGLESLVSQVNLIAIRNILVRQSSTTSVTTIAAGLNGLYTVAAFFAKLGHDLRNPETRYPTALVQGISVSSENLFGRHSIALGIDQLISLKKSSALLRDNYPTVLNVGLSTTFTKHIIPVRFSPIRNNRNSTYYGSYEIHSGAAWRQDVPPGGVEYNTSASYLTGGYGNGLSYATGGTLFVGFPGSFSASFGFLYNYSVTTNRFVAFSRKLNAPLRLTVPSGISSQFGFSIYIGDFPSFENIATTGSVLRWFV